MNSTPSLRPPSRGRTVAAAALALWVLGLAMGFRALIGYELQAGTAAVGPASWVPAEAIRFDPERPNLVMFAHPQCPCTRASVAELAVIMTKAQGRLRATVCFFDPDEETAAWTESSLWRSAAAIPGVEVVADRNGSIAERFGSATSGQTFVFDPSGRLTFAGGITGARGHIGENRGRTLVLAIARGVFGSPASTPVFGCALADAPAPAAAIP